MRPQVDQLTDRLKRTLAEMENVRMRATREIETAKKFGPQPLIKVRVARLARGVWPRRPRM
eukprot:363564-Chlamydomonas_euryale.AAC.4